MPRSLLPGVAVATALLLVPTGGAEAARTAGPSATVHSSDGRPGMLLADAVRRPGAREAPAEPERAWPVGPGVTYREWTVSRRQGQVRLHLLRADLDEPGVSLDLVSGARVSDRAPFSRLLARAGARAGVNADFFDIADTGAPLGVGRSRGRGLLHAPRTGWNTVAAVGSDGTPRVGTSALVGEVRMRDGWSLRLDGLNTPVLRAGQVGAWTRAWGTSPGRRVVEGATRVRAVVVREGRVRSIRSRVPRTGPVAGVLLVGRERGATALARLRVGQRVRVLTGTNAPRDRVAVGGSVVLLRAGQPATSDNGELHPRTAFGYDRDTHEVLLLVADGRSESSSGLTLLQLARVLRGLGADEALNLDGGGSSTMVAPDVVGAVGVRNRPSDGHERRVPNGLAIRYASGSTLAPASR